jgi:hypothetical protein
MTQNVTLTPDRSSSPASALSLRATIYTQPDDVSNDPKLTLAEKREILASWISDAHAVESAPALRRLDSGAVVEVDAILRVLVSLDALVPRPRENRKHPSPSPRRRSVMTKWLRRIGPQWKNSKDDDDDPPFAPAGFGVPFRPTIVTAHGAPAERSRGLACATG